MKFTWKTVSGIVGAVVAGFAIMLGATFLAYPAISQLAGLAVAQTATQWNNVIDAAKGDAQQSGILAMAPYLWNGLTLDRQRGTIANGAAVDVTRISGSTTPADGFANPTTANTMWDLLAGLNGTTWDRLRTASATDNTATTSLGALQVVPLSTWSQTNFVSIAATAATTSKGAGGGTVRHVATTVSACFHDSAINTVARIVHLRDGATGAGTVLRTWLLSSPVAGEAECINISGLNMTGSANTAMTLEFSAAPAATASETVGLTGYSTP